MGIEGLLVFVRHYGLTQTGARRYEGEAQRGRQAVSVSVSLELHLGQVEATVRVAPVDPSTGLMACARAHWLGALSPQLTPTGDVALDEAVALVVPDVTVLGLLDADTRTELRLALASGEVVLEDGVFVATFSPDLHSSGSLESACERLVTLAHTFSLPRKRWLEHTLRLATRDLDPRVRNELHRHLEADPKLHAELELHRMKSREAAVGDHDSDLDTLLARLSNPTLEAPSRAAALPALLSHLSVAKVLGCAQAERGLWPMLANYGSGEGFDMLLRELDNGLTKDLMAREPDPTLELLEFLWPSAKRSRPGTAMPFAAMLQRLGHPGGLDMVSLLLDTKDQTRFFAALDALTALTDDPDILENRLGERGSSRLASWLPAYLAPRPPHPTDLSLFGIALAELSEHAEHLDEALGLLDLLAQRMGPDAEPDLLAYLDHPNDTLVHRAIELLGEVGQREAQIALEPLTSGLFRPSELKRLARSSLTRLHERLGPLSEGGLALADSQEGGLSLSGAPRPLDDRDS